MCAISSLTSTFAISPPDEFLYYLATMGNSKVHSLERTRRYVGLRAVTVLQWRPKPYRVDGVAKLQPSSLCLLSDIKSTNVSLSFIGRYLLVYCREYQTAHRSLVSTIAIFTVLRPRERWQSIVMSASVCLSVREHISRTARAIFAKFLRMLHMAVARSSSSGVAQSEGEGAILGFFPH